MSWNGIGGTNYVASPTAGQFTCRHWAPNTLGAPGNPAGWGVLDIGANSKVVVTNNATGYMPALVASGQLEAFEGNGTVQYVYNAGNNTTVITGLAPAGPTTPVFSTQPTNAILKIGGTATFTAAASPATGYQWLFNSAPIANGGGISGATTATLTIANFRYCQYWGLIPWWLPTLLLVRAIVHIPSAK